LLSSKPLKATFAFFRNSATTFASGMTFTNSPWHAAQAEETAQAVGLSFADPRTTGTIQWNHEWTRIISSPLVR
jgi:hypothetical protein